MQKNAESQNCMRAGIGRSQVRIKTTFGESRGLYWPIGNSLVVWIDDLGIIVTVRGIWQNPYLGAQSSEVNRWDEASWTKIKEIVERSRQNAGAFARL